MTKQKNDADGYFSPKELAVRWSCHPSTVQRIAKREQFAHIFLGHGRNGMVRYLIKEILAYENQRCIKPTA